MKNSPFLTHDLGARNDPKLLELQMEMKGQGLAIFWCLVEMLWENDGKLPENYKSIAFALRWCKPAEVEKVVKDYGLFQVADGFITSRSASERIDHKRDTITSRSNAGKASGAARSTNAEQKPNKCSTNDEQMLNECSPINKLINNNKERKENKIKERPPLTAAKIFEILFFKNIKDPVGELQRFVEYYDGYGWKYQDGTPVDPEQAAEDWKPKLQGKRFNDEALRWYHAVWNAARTREQDAADNFLVQLDSLRLNGQQLSVTFKTATAGHAVGQFILDNDLAGDYRLDFRVSN